MGPKRAGLGYQFSELFRTSVTRQAAHTAIQVLQVAIGYQWASLEGIQAPQSHSKEFKEIRWTTEAETIY